MRIKIFAVVSGIVMTSFVTQARADCAQISPNPNPVGSIITNTSTVGCNELVPFKSFGTLINIGTLENAGELRNFGALMNIGTLNNFGDLVNVESSAGYVKNTGALNNFGSIGGYGSTNNIGILNNYGTLNAGDFGENTGVVNNYSGATLLSDQRFTNGGVVNNARGATVGAKVGWINNGTVNNSGALSYENSRYLNNNGVLNNNSGATLRTRRELNNIGLLRNDGTLANDGTISTSGQILVSDSGRVTGSGNYRQSAGTTFVHGSMTQTAVYINGGVLSGSGSITSLVRLDGGTLAPGDSPGVLTILGDYKQTGAGSFAVEIGGPSRGIGYDVLSVSGTASLDGEIKVILYDFGGGAFSPRQGDTFDVLRAEFIIGNFSRISPAPSGKNLRWAVSYLKDAIGTIDVVRLAVTPVAE